MYRVLLTLALITATGMSAAAQTNFASSTVDAYADLRSANNARAREQAQEVRLKEQQFVATFNRLAAALDDFSKTYKAQHVIDVKKVESIKAAYRKLESADPWFKTQ